MSYDLFPDERQLAPAGPSDRGLPTAPRRENGLDVLDRDVSRVLQRVYGDDWVAARTEIGAAIRTGGSATFSHVATHPEAYGPVADRALAPLLGAALRAQSEVLALASSPSPVPSSLTAAAPTLLVPGTPGPEQQRNAAVLEAAFRADPFALLEVPHREHRDFSDLARHGVSKEVADLMQRDMPQNITMNYKRDTSTEGPKFEVQNLRDASGPVVNLDYYAVRVSKDALREKGYSPEGYLNHLRLNINDYTDGADFATYPGMKGEPQRWQSTNPTGSVVTIALGPGGLEGASVVTSHVAPDKWIFSTVWTPRDGYHPVSGNREFGVSDNNDGTVTFYTRGVDRISGLFFRGVDTVAGVAGAGVFDGGDAVWRSFQDHIHSDFPGNRSEVHAPVIHRPDYAKVKSILNGER